MADLSVFESRTGNLKCKPDEIYNFVTDIRNFEQFIPDGQISSWHADRDSCSFHVSIAGMVSVRLSEKLPYSKVVFNGDALKQNDFTLTLNIRSASTDAAEIKILLEAELNPLLKMVASKPVTQFLEILVVEMEKFQSWRNIIK